ncbi:MAG: hypothetical protein KAR64_10430 [Thermoplasmatales archaeon]|nr:hypothetical protein [Thermoplasmatales archaeon]
MEKNMPEREDFDEVESKEITLDFEDVIVQPVDGVIIQGDDEEIKLLLKKFTKKNTFKSCLLY